MTRRAAWLGALLAAVGVPAWAQHNGTAVTIEAAQITQWLSGTFHSDDGATLRVVEAPVRDVDPQMLYMELQRGKTPPEYWLLGLIADAGRKAAEDNVRVRRYWVNNDFRQAFAGGAADPGRLRALRLEQLSHLEGCDIRLRPRDRATYAGESDPTTCISDTDGGPFYMQQSLTLRADAIVIADRTWHDSTRHGRPSESSTLYRRAGH